MTKRAAEQSLQVHQSVVCDACEISPITGIRYKCSVCPDFDLCEKCEATNAHEHPMLKIRKHEQAPVFFRCTYGENLSESQFKQQPDMMKSSSL